MTFTTIHVSKEPDYAPSDFEFHIDHIHRSDEMHLVFYNTREGHDTEGWMMSKEEAMKAARAILAAYENPVVSGVMKQLDAAAEEVSKWPEWDRIQRGDDVE